MRPTALAALALVACSPDTPLTDSAPPPLDCNLSFEALEAAVLAQPLTPAPKDSAQPYRFFSTEDGRGSYLITEADAPAHPAIMMQRASGGKVATTGCRYGDKASYDALLKYLDGLKTWRRS